jgi:hypothetical protein
VAQWIELQIADLAVVGSSPAEDTICMSEKRTKQSERLVMYDPFYKCERYYFSKRDLNREFLIVRALFDGRFTTYTLVQSFSGQELKNLQRLQAKWTKGKYTTDGFLQYGGVA